ncbi:hypothetical protein FRC17_003857 [Serendipita sp. 399]|nr:hypothetical protein FRC17_003857 [Serendipita sp. 399]
MQPCHRRTQTKLGPDWTRHSMALNAYTIYSDNRSGTLESQDETQSHDEDGMQKPDGERSHRIHIQFVPAKSGYDDLGRPILGIDQSPRDAKVSADGGIGDWYMSLQRSQRKEPPPRRVSGTKSKDKALPVSSEGGLKEVSGPERPIQNNWFRPASSVSLQERKQSSSLAEMLRREPPNPENPLVPPVYYAIGPTNKGYEMLTKGGWEEGQPLGPAAASASASASSVQGVRYSRQVEKKEKWVTLYGSMPKLLVPKVDGAGVEVVDISREEEESESSSWEDDDTPMFEQATNDGPAAPGAIEPRIRSGEVSKFDKPILTPIPVALKNDRVGLGAEKRKRLVTHSSLAIQHHIQQGRINQKHHISEMRRMERDHLRGTYDRGKRAYARKAKEEEEKRKRLREYMKS